MTTTNPKPQAMPKDAIAALRQRKAAVRKQLQESSAYIKATTRKMFAPPPKTTSKIGMFMNMVDQGMAIYDGVMMGLKVANNIRRIFRRRK